MRAGNPHKILLLVFLCLSSFVLRAQNRPANIWASVQFNKSRVVVGEPLLVTITVYTSTWFTAPPEFSEIQVPEAMMVDYQQRTGSTRKTIGNKTYPAIEKKYVVYPFRTGENSLPSLTIVTQSPDEGDYKGKRKVIKSPERKFTVLAPPDEIATDNWLTAFNLSLSEQWDKPMDGLKQGDVRERQISIRANGALAALIPPMDPQAGSFGTVYSRPASLDNVQNESSFTGTRIEHWTYLMSAEGQHTIPGVIVSWYDPGSGQLERASIEEQVITIAENPNLDFLLSMQDSLQVLLETGEQAGEQKPFEWMGLKWWQLAVIVLCMAALIFILPGIFQKFIYRVKEKKTSSRESEKWYFDQLIKAGSEAPEVFMRTLLTWYDRYRGDLYGPELDSFVCASGDHILRQHLSQLERILYAGAESEDWNGGAMVEHIRLARKKTVGKRGSLLKDALDPLNPEDRGAVPCVKGEQL